MARVVHFEIHAEHPERAIQFYQKSFGWEFHKFKDTEGNVFGTMQNDPNAK